MSSPDEKLREMALRLSVDSFRIVAGVMVSAKMGHALMTESVTERARAYYDFLRGEPAKEESDE